MPDQNNVSDLLSVNEAAEYLHLKPSTIRDWIFKRRIPFVKLGRRVFIRMVDVENLISANLVPAHNETTYAEV